MGLGKSVIIPTTIRQLIQRRKAQRVLVVAPLRVVKQTWSKRTEKWDHLKDLNYLVVTDSKSQGIKALQRDANIYTINRENLKWLIESSGTPFDYDVLMVNELSNFESYRPQRSKAFERVQPLVKRIVGLAGTLPSNSLMNL